MALLWFVLAVVVFELAAALFAAESRPGFERKPRWWRDRRVLSITIELTLGSKLPSGR